jgi:hypothetical protein
MNALGKNASRIGLIFSFAILAVAAPVISRCQSAAKVPVVYVVKGRRNPTVIEIWKSPAAQGYPSSPGEARHNASNSWLATATLSRFCRWIARVDAPNCGTVAVREPKRPPLCASDQQSLLQCSPLRC